MGKTSTLNVSLTPELTAFISAQVASGRYQTASEVVREALRLLEEKKAAAAARKPPGRQPAAVDSDQGRPPT